MSDKQFQVPAAAVEVHGSAVMDAVTTVVSGGLSGAVGAVVQAKLSPRPAAPIQPAPVAQSQADTISWDGFPPRER